MPRKNHRGGFISPKKMAAKSKASPPDLELLQLARARNLLDAVIIYDHGSRDRAKVGFEYLANLNGIPDSDFVTPEVYIYADAAWELLEQLAYADLDGAFETRKTYPAYIVNTVLCFAQSLGVRNFGPSRLRRFTGSQDPMQQVPYPELPNKRAFKKLFVLLALGHEMVLPETKETYEDNKNFHATRMVIKESILNKFKDYGKGDLTDEQNYLLDEELGSKYLGKIEVFLGSDMYDSIRKWRDNCALQDMGSHQKIQNRLQWLVDYERDYPAARPTPEKQDPGASGGSRQTQWVRPEDPMDHDQLESGRARSKSRRRNRSRSRRRQDSTRSKSRDPSRSRSQGPPPAKRDLKRQYPKEFPAQVTASTTVGQGRRKMPPPPGLPPLEAAPAAPPTARSYFEQNPSPISPQVSWDPFNAEPMDVNWASLAVSLPTVLGSNTGVTPTYAAQGSLAAASASVPKDPNRVESTFKVSLPKAEMECYRRVMRIYDVGFRKTPIYAKELIRTVKGGAILGDVDAFAKRIQKATELIRDHPDGATQRVVPEPSISLMGFGPDPAIAGSQEERTLMDLCRYMAALQHLYYRCNPDAYQQDYYACYESNWTWNVRWCGMAQELLFGILSVVDNFKGKWNELEVAEWALAGPQDPRPMPKYPVVDQVEPRSGSNYEAGPRAYASYDFIRRVALAEEATNQTEIKEPAPTSKAPIQDPGPLKVSEIPVPPGNPVVKPSETLDPKTFRALAQKQMEGLGAPNLEAGDTNPPTPVGELDSGFNRMSLESSPDMKVAAAPGRGVGQQELSTAIEALAPTPSESGPEPMVTGSPGSQPTSIKLVTKSDQDQAPKRATGGPTLIKVPVSQKPLTTRSKAQAGRLSPITAQDDACLDGKNQ